MTWAWAISLYLDLNPSELALNDEFSWAKVICKLASVLIKSLSSSDKEILSVLSVVIFRLLSKFISAVFFTNSSNLVFRVLSSIILFILSFSFL